MGLFNQIKTAFTKKTYGGTLYYSSQWAVDGYFVDRKGLTLKKTFGGTFEAMLLHAAMMNLLFKQKFPNKHSQYFDEYMDELGKDLASKKDEFKRITGFEITSDFILLRLQYYVRRWIALLSREEELLDDVGHLLYSKPLTNLPEEGMNRIRYVDSPTMDLFGNMCSTYLGLSKAIDGVIKE
jgi:hypothetical protein